VSGAGKRSYVIYLLSIGLCSLLCGTALRAQFDAGYYGPESSGSIRQMLPHAGASVAVYEVGTYPLYAADLEPGDGRGETESYCNTCHSPRYITMQPPLPADVWTAEVNKMTKIHGASIPDDAKQKIIEYLHSHYTPETRKR
jgi:hypothetical protein